MNCFAETNIPQPRPGDWRSRLTVGIWTITVAATLLSGCGVSTSESAGETPADAGRYRIEITVSPERNKEGASVEMKVSQSRASLREIRMSIDPEQISEITGSGDLQIANDVAIWKPGEKGGSIRWFARLQHRRGNAGFDAYIEHDWALFRAEDVIPRASTRTSKGASSETWLSFDLPAGWSSVTPYFGRDHRYHIDDPQRRFDLPSGWITLGRVGVRFDTIAGILAKVAAPEGQGARRMDILAMLRWTLPEIKRVLPEFPDRLTVVSAGAPMWRGGLSGPKSLFMHADRPLLSENSTSTLLHEVFHVGFGPWATPGADWIIEGLAEFYSLQFLVRSGTISNERFISALASQEKWGRDVSDLCVQRSSGSVTARAVSVFVKLDAEIRAATNKRYSLDDVTRALAIEDTKISLDNLRSNVVNVMGKNSDTLASANLPGCGK
jgi:hypothetical protein